MYRPPHFAEDRLPVLHDAITRSGIANLVTLGPGGLFATPLPLFVDPDEGEFGTLYGHVAKANPQWKHVPAVDALAIFMGPDAYVTPSWYPTKAATGKVVPTWNYITVHATGPVTFFEDATTLLDVVTRLTQRQENRRVAPWAVSDAPAAFVQSQLKGIVGLRMPIRVIEGKWKVSQNRNEADRRGVAEGMAAEGVAMSELIK